MIPKGKFILDACCGYRMMWFDKKHPNTIFLDERDSVNPDMVGDFRDLKFNDNSFKLVVWDVPHIVQKEIGKGKVTDAYGVLNPDTWENDLRKGFKEIMRVLDNYGILIFKWSDCNKWANISRGVNVNKVLSLFPIKPLFGHKTKAVLKKTENKETSATYWFCFMKIPNQEKIQNDIRRRNKRRHRV